MCSSAVEPDRRAKRPSPRSPLFGRAQALSALKRWATGRKGTQPDAASPLCALSGPPGVGKTRLALALRDALANRPLSIHFIDLTASRSEADLVDAVASALSAPISEGSDTEKASASICTWLQNISHDALLILDNFEQLDQASSLQVLRWLSAAPRVKALVTTRISSPWPETSRVTLPPLLTRDISHNAGSSADPDADPDADPALSLLIARARRHLPDLNPCDPTTYACLSRIVHALDGLPLALELAAARLAMMSLAEVEARLTQCLPLLDHTFDGVPKSLAAALEASWSLLTPNAQRALTRCAELRAPFDLDAAEALLCDTSTAPSEDPALSTSPSSGDTLNAIQQLLDASLLQRPLPDARLRLAAPIRAFAAAKLLSLGPAAVATVRARFYRHYAGLAATVRAALLRAQDDAPLLTLLRVREHLKWAIDAALDATTDPSSLDAALDAALGLDALARRDNIVSDVLIILRRVLAATSSHPCDPHRRVELLASAWRIARLQGLRPLQGQLIDTALSLLSLPDLHPHTASVIHHAAAVHIWSSGDRTAALSHTKHALSHASSDPILCARASTVLAWLAHDLGDLSTSIQHAEQAVLNLAAEGARYEWLIAANNLSVFYKQLGDLEAAYDLSLDALTAARDLRCAHLELHALQALASIELTTDHPSFSLHQAAFDALEPRLFNPQARINNLLNDAWHAIFHHGDATLAFATIDRALALQVSHGVARMRSFTLQSFAELQLLLGHSADAAATLQEALSSARPSGSAPHLSLLLSLSASAQAASDPSAARALLSQALDLGLHISDPIFQLGLSLERLYIAAYLDPASLSSPDALAPLVFSLTPKPSPSRLGVGRPPWQHNRYMRATTARALAAVPLAARRDVWAQALKPAPSTFLWSHLDPSLTRAPDGAWVELQSKPVLSRILSALLRARADGSLSPLSPDVCIEAGWLDERILPSAALIRLHQAITRLRRALPPDALESFSGGYRLAPYLHVCPIPSLTALSPVSTPSPPG